MQLVLTLLKRFGRQRLNCNPLLLYIYLSIDLHNIENKTVPNIDEINNLFANFTIQGEIYQTMQLLQKHITEACQIKPSSTQLLLK